MNVICLANSYKHQGRCIGGIAIDSGEWVRPVSDLDDGRIPLDNQLINAEEINLLDIVKIPINRQRKLSYESESYGYNYQPWQVVGKAEIVRLLNYCEAELLYSRFEKSIPFSYLRRQPVIRTLQLIETKSVAFDCDYQNSQRKWKAIINDQQYGISGLKISITDPVALDKLNQGQSLSSHCLLCMSFSQPWQRDTNDDLRCYRLVAGIIELLPELEMITQAMKKIGWDINQGQQYLQKTFDKRSRYQLNQAEAQAFLQYLDKIDKNQRF